LVNLPGAFLFERATLLQNSSRPLPRFELRIAPGSHKRADARHRGSLLRFADARPNRRRAAEELLPPHVQHGGLPPLRWAFHTFSLPATASISRLQVENDSCVAAADRLARPSPWTALGFIDSVGRAARADDLDSFVLPQIASYRAVGHIGLGMHHAGDRAVERSGDVDHVSAWSRVQSLAAVASEQTKIKAVSI
jgi:hypothetical protein